MAQHIYTSTAPNAFRVIFGASVTPEILVILVSAYSFGDRIVLKHFPLANFIRELIIFLSKV